MKVNYCICKNIVFYADFLIIENIFNADFLN